MNSEILRTAKQLHAQVLSGSFDYTEISEFVAEFRNEEYLEEININNLFGAGNRTKVVEYLTSCLNKIIEANTP